MTPRWARSFRRFASVEDVGTDGDGDGGVFFGGSATLRGFAMGVGWWIAGEPEVRFDQRLVAPDLAGWRVDRVPEMPDDDPITPTPDWCCEVRSPTTAREDRTVKLPHYARSGVGWIWIVDPELHAVEVSTRR